MTIHNKEALIWLAETDNSETYMTAVCSRFPATLVISYQDVPTETISHFSCLVPRGVPPITEMVLYMSGFHSQWDLGIHLAEAVNQLRHLTVLHISIKCIVDTSFLVDFVCECFAANDHVETLWLEGPMNVAENLTPSEHKRVQRVFKGGDSSSSCSSSQGGCGVKLKHLVLDHFSYHHRVGYLLNCWPDIFEQLHIRRSNLDNISERINQKISRCRDLTTFRIDNSYVPCGTMLSICRHIRDNVQMSRLHTIELSVVSAGRKFSKSDVKKPSFVSSLSADVCQVLAAVLTSSPSLQHLVLGYNGLADSKARLILQAAAKSTSLLTLDLTGNVITNDVEDDVIQLLKAAPQMTSLLLADNVITAPTRSNVIKASLALHDLRLSL